MSANKHIDKGWAILSTGTALIILLLVSSWGYSLVNDWQTKRTWMNTARQVSRFTQAVKSYTGRFYDTLLSSATTTVPVTVTPMMLKNTGFLEQGFSETSSDGQTFQAAIVRNATNTDQLQALVYTQSGTPLPFLALRHISMDITAGMGGYIWTSGMVTGAMSSWTIPLTNFGVSTTQGHIAALLTTDELGAARGESDRLYRFSVNGKPDLNTMHTNIDMGGNNLNNTGTVNAVTGLFSGNVTAGNAITANSDIRSNNGWLITRNEKGWLNETWGGGFYMSDNDWVRAVNNKNIYSGGQIRGGTVQADGRLSTSEYLQIDGMAAAGSSCSGRLVGLDSYGSILTCQNQKWQSVAGGAYSRMATGGLTLYSPATYQHVLVTASSLFNGKDGSHTAYANFDVMVNNQLAGTLTNSVVVHKGGNSGHSWIYQSHAVAQKMFSFAVPAGSQVSVSLASSAWHVSSDIRVDLTN